MKYAKIYNLKPADQIVESITLLGITKHFALYLGMDRYGVEWIAENKKFVGVRIVTADEYFKDALTIVRIEKFAGSDVARRAVVRNAQKSVGNVSSP